RETEPVVGRFLLPSVPDGLPEDAVLVTQAVAHRGELQRCSRFNEARCQTSKPAVAQARIRLLFQDFDQINSLVAAELVRQGSEQKIRNVIRERSANEEFHREVIQ